MLYQGWKDTIALVNQRFINTDAGIKLRKQIQSQVLTKCWTKTSLKDVFIVKIFFEIIFSCDIMFEDKR